MSVWTNYTRVSTSLKLSAISTRHRGPVDQKTLRGFSVLSSMLSTAQPLIITLIATNAMKRPAYVEWSVYQSAQFKSAPVFNSALRRLRPHGYGLPFDLGPKSSRSCVRGRAGFYADRYCCFRQIDRIRRAPVLFSQAGGGRRDYNSTTVWNTQCSDWNSIWIRRRTGRR